MVTAAILATFPARRDSVGNTVESLIGQVDQVFVVANEFRQGELDPQLPRGTRVIVPHADLKDTGKFHHRFGDDDFVLLCDDDIRYPVDYLERMRAEYLRLEHLKPIIGVHGVTYPDFFDGDASNRLVHVFHQKLAESCFVNQLGTGTVLCRGYQLPGFAFMESSARFVDLRFAIHCERQGYPRVCIRREKGWMTEWKSDVSLFETFTKLWPTAVTREAQAIAGLRFLPDGSALRLLPEHARPVGRPVPQRLDAPARAVGIGLDRQDRV